MELTHSEGAFLMKYAMTQLPEKMGTDEFTVQAQATCDDQMRSMRASLRAVSPLANPPHYRATCFGMEEAWESVRTAQRKCSRCDHVESREVDQMQLKPEFASVHTHVDFDEDGLFGIYWALYLAMHPRSLYRANLVDLDEIVFELARKSGWDEALREKLGTAKKPDFLPKRRLSMPVERD